MAITITTPKMPETAVRMPRGISPSLPVALTKGKAKATIVTSMEMVKKWRAGSKTARLGTIDCSLATAITDPVKVTMPMNTPE
jgi:hypothetical protein